MPAPFKVFIKYEDDVYVIRQSDFDNFLLVDPASALPFDRFAISRTADWRKGLFVGLQAAIAFHDQAGLSDDSGGAQDGADAGAQDDDD